MKYNITKLGVVCAENSTILEAIKYVLSHDGQYNIHPITDPLVVFLNNPDSYAGTVVKPSTGEYFEYKDIYLSWREKPPLYCIPRLVSHLETHRSCKYTGSVRLTTPDQAAKIYFVDGHITSMEIKAR
jgi:hypothetical protein